MRNEAMMKHFPNNLFDDLEIEMPTEQPEDFLATLMYILRCVSNPRDSKAIMMRYKDGKSYEEIGEAFGLSKQRAHYMVQEILCKFTKQYLEMLKKGIKKYTEDLLIERINELKPIIEESERVATRTTAYEDGYKKGYEDGLAQKEANTINQDVLKTIDIESLQFSVRTYNALSKNGIEYLYDVIECGDDLLDFNSFGKTCFHELAETLSSYGVNVNQIFPMCVKKWGVN